MQRGVDVGASEAGGEQAGGEPVSRAGGVHDLGRHGLHRADLVTPGPDRAVRAQLQHDLGHRPGQRQRDRSRRAVHSGCKCPSLVKVGEQQAGPAYPAQELGGAGPA